MTVKKLLLAVSIFLAPVVIVAQGRGVPPAELLKPLVDSWPTYSGDYTGRRFSALALINRLTVKNLSLGWVSSVTPGPGGGGGRGGRGGGGGVIVGGLGTIDFPPGGGSGMKGTPLMVDGTLYVSTPDNAWALDARDGREIWHYYWKTRGGTHIANRGLGIWNGFLYMVTPDNYLVSLEAKTGRDTR